MIRPLCMCAGVCVYICTCVHFAALPHPAPAKGGTCTGRSRLSRSLHSSLIVCSRVPSLRPGLGADEFFLGCKEEKGRVRCPDDESWAQQKCTSGFASKEREELRAKNKKKHKKQSAVKLRSFLRESAINFQFPLHFRPSVAQYASMGHLLMVVRTLADDAI